MNEYSYSESSEEEAMIETALLEAQQSAEATDLRYSGEEVYQRMRAIIPS
jgi:hypothetical protein